MVESSRDESIQSVNTVDQKIMKTIKEGKREEKREGLGVSSLYCDILQALREVCTLCTVVITDDTLMTLRGGGHFWKWLRDGSSSL